MISSVWHPAVQAALDAPRTAPLPPFSSPQDWRDGWIYFLMIDRFNNPAAPPRHMPFDDPNYSLFQGGTFAGVQAQLPYIRDLGASAIWLTPVLKNCQYSNDSYHGYGIQDFLSAEPRFASNPANADRELRALVDAAHSLGLYVIFDIVLNHAGNIFAYVCSSGDAVCHSSGGAQASFSNSPMNIMWRDGSGAARADWPVVENIQNPPADAVVWPVELQRNQYFRRQGTIPGWNVTAGDFMQLKQLLTVDASVQNALIRIYQLVIAKYDIDGFRIDTLKYLTCDYARTFGNAIREYALTLGKKNFFTFGEVFSGDENALARFIGRAATESGDMVGVDAALDFPLVFTLGPVAKGMAPPSALSAMFDRRRHVESDIISSHGDASAYFVTFLDNHDLKKRFYFQAPGSPHQFDAQLTLALTCLLCLQGVPCVYYGTEQGLHGFSTTGQDAAVREALWGKSANAFDQTVPFYQALSAITQVRNQKPALRYGRQYFRPISGDGRTFGVSPYAPGIVAFSRILADQEVVVAANADTSSSHTVWVIVDSSLHQPGDVFTVLNSNTGPAGGQVAVHQFGSGNVTVYEVSGGTTNGPLNAIQVTLGPMEAQILAPASS